MPNYQSSPAVHYCTIHYCPADLMMVLCCVCQMCVCGVAAVLCCSYHYVLNTAYDDTQVYALIKQWSSCGVQAGVVVLAYFDNRCILG